MYLDSGILVKQLVREPDREFYGQLTDGRPVTSVVLAYTEVWAALIAKERTSCRPGRWLPETAACATPRN